MKKEITPLQERFALEYMKDLNGTQAAIRAGYSKRTANEQAGRMLVNVSIQKRISELKERQFKRLEINADTILKELMVYAFSDITEVLGKIKNFSSITAIIKDIRKLPEGTRRLVTNIEKTRFGTKVSFVDKQAALIALGKHLKLFTDNTEHSGQIFRNDLANMSLEELRQKRERLEKELRE